MPGPSNSAIPVFNDCCVCLRLVLSFSLGCDSSLGLTIFFVGVGGCSSEGESLLLILESVMSSLNLFLCAATTGLCSLLLSSCN